METPLNVWNPGLSKPMAILEPWVHLAYGNIGTWPLSSIFWWSIDLHDHVSICDHVISNGWS